MKKSFSMFLTILLGGCLVMTGQEPPQPKKYAANVLPREAFKGSRQLRKITLPESLREVESRVFLDCKNLEQIVIPSQTTNQFNLEAFPDQKGLYLYVPSEATKMALMGMFHFTQTKIVVGAPQSLKGVTTPTPFAIATTGNALTITTHQSGDLRLYSASGELLWQTPVNTQSSYTRELPSGVYLLQLNDQIQALTL